MNKALIRTKNMSRGLSRNFQSSQTNVYTQIIAFVGRTAHATAAYSKAIGNSFLQKFVRSIDGVISMNAG